MRNSIESIGIVDLLWDYDEYETEYKKAFMQFKIKQGGIVENIFFLLDNDTVYKEELFESSNINFKQIGIENNKFKIQFGGEIILLTSQQVKRLELILSKRVK